MIDKEAVFTRGWDFVGISTYPGLQQGQGPLQIQYHLTWSVRDTNQKPAFTLDKTNVASPRRTLYEGLEAA